MNFDFRLPEADAILASVRSCHPRRLLDVGTGRGIITKEVAALAPVIATELFQCALQEAAQRCPQSVCFVQAHPSSLPFPDRYFDTVACTQLIDHLETPVERARVLAEVARVLHPSGKAVFTVLHQNFRFDNFKKSKEGTDEGVYYHRYYVEEFQEQLERYWHIDYMQGIWTYLPKTYPIYTRLGRYVVYWERIIRRTRLSLRYGKVLLAVCSPRESSVDT